MSAFFDIYMSPPQEDGQISIHPRLVHPSRHDTREMMHRISEGTTLTPADMRATFSAVASFLQDQLIQGGSVNIEGIGSFRVVPHFAKPKHKGDKVTGKDVAVKRIVFTPDPVLRYNVANRINFERRGARHSSSMNEAKAVLLLREYFQEHDYITVGEFEALAHTTETSSRRLLNGLVRKEHLLPKRAGRTILYHANRYHYPLNH